MDATTLKQFREVIDKPNGIVLVTGPTGSGKTTTLYSALSELNSIEDKLITTEDPVEYDIDGIIQVPIDADIGNTFAHMPAGHSAAGSGQDPGRRNSRLGNGRDRRAGVAHRATWCSARCTPTTRPSTITRLRDMGVPHVFDHGHGRSDPGPAAGAADLHAVPRRVHAQPRKCCTDLELTPDDVARQEVLPRRGLRRLQQHRLQGPRGLVRADDHERRPARHDHGQRSTDELRDAARSSTAWSRCAHAGMQSCFDGITTLDEVVRETILEA